MKFTINSLDGEARFVSLGSFTFEGLTEWEAGGGDWDYRIVDDSVVNGMQTYSIRLGGNGFNNINTEGATNLMIVPPNDIIVAISEGHYSINPVYIDRVYDEDSPAPADFDLGRYEYYYTINTRSSTDQSVKFDEFNLVGTNGWDSSIKHYKITALSQVLFRPSQNCFGVGTRLSFQGSGQSSIRIKADYTILNRFLGTYGEWALTANNQWSPRKGGVLNGTTMFSNEPWDYVSYSAETLVKAPFSAEEVADGNLPVLPEFNPKSGFYLVDLEYDGEPLVGILGVQKNAEGVITDASIWACARDFWSAKEAPPYSGPTSDVQGGNGTFTKNPGTGTLGAINSTIAAWGRNAAGFYGGYNMYSMDVYNLAPFTEFSKNVRNPALMTQYENLFVDPLSSIICCHAIPHLLAPQTSGTKRIVVNDSFYSNTAAPVFTNPITSSTDSQTGAIFEIDLPEYYGSFLDYTDTSVYLHLPYIGMVQLDTTACIGGHVSVEYSCDVVSGDVVAFVNTIDRSGSQENRYSYKGNCAYEIPMQTYRSVLVGLSPALMTAASGIISAGLGVGGIGAIGAIGGVRNYFQETSGGFPNFTDLKEMGSWASVSARGAVNEATRSGSLQRTVGGIESIMNGLGAAAHGGAGTLSSNGGAGNATAPVDTRCWILVVRPEQSNPQYYAAQNGYPSDIGGIVDDFAGLLATASVELNGLKATDDEKAEITELLSRGVYTSDPYI